MPLNRWDSPPPSRRQQRPPRRPLLWPLSPHSLRLLPGRIWNRRFGTKWPRKRNRLVPLAPDCGCTSIFADKDETGAVVITCLNCGRKWHPGSTVPGELPLLLPAPGLLIAPGQILLCLFLHLLCRQHLLRGLFEGEQLAHFAFCILPACLRISRRASDIRASLSFPHFARVPARLLGQLAEVGGAPVHHPLDQRVLRGLLPRRSSPAFCPSERQTLSF